MRSHCKEEYKTWRADKKVVIPWNMSEHTFKYFVVLLSGFQLDILNDYRMKSAVVSLAIGI